MNEKLMIENADDANQLFKIIWRSILVFLLMCGLIIAILFAIHMHFYLTLLIAVCVGILAVGVFIWVNQLRSNVESVNLASGITLEQPLSKELIESNQNQLAHENKSSIALDLTEEGTIEFSESKEKLTHRRREKMQMKHSSMLGGYANEISEHSKEELARRAYCSIIQEMHIKYCKEIDDILGGKSLTVTPYLTLEKLKTKFDTEKTKVEQDFKFELNNLNSDLDMRGIGWKGIEDYFIKARKGLEIWSAECVECFNAKKKSCSQKFNDLKQFDLQDVINSGYYFLTSIPNPVEFQTIQDDLIIYIRTAVYDYCQYYFSECAKKKENDFFDFYLLSNTPPEVVQKKINLENLIQLEIDLNLEKKLFGTLKKELSVVINFLYIVATIDNKASKQEITFPLDVFAFLLEKTSIFFDSYAEYVGQFYFDHLLSDTIGFYEKKIINEIQLAKGNSIDGKIQNAMTIIEKFKNNNRNLMYKDFFEQLFLNLTEKNNRLYLKQDNKIQEIEAFRNQALKVLNQLKIYIFSGKQAEAMDFFEASLKEFRKSYYTLAKKYHPNSNLEKREVDVEHFKIINEINEASIKNWRRIIEGENIETSENTDSKIINLSHENVELLKKLSALLDEHIHLLDEEIDLLERSNREIKVSNREIKIEIAEQKKEIEDLRKQFSEMKKKDSKASFFSNQAPTKTTVFFAPPTELPISNLKNEQPIKVDLPETILPQ